MCVEDFLDGVMINLFYDNNSGRWRLATRSRLDADTKFYDHTFADLFMATWTGSMGLPANFNDCVFLNRQNSYSFVLQHPLNRIVVPVTTAQLVCVEISTITPDSVLYTTAVSEHIGLTCPQRFPVQNINDLIHLIAGFDTYQGLNRQGLVIKDYVTGVRWKVRTSTYNAVRKLRGNHSRLEYVWFDNLRNNTLDTYLNAYPEERERCTKMIAKWSQIISDTYNWYVRSFKVRDVEKETSPAHFKGLLYDLHGYYLKSLAPVKKSLTWEEWQKMMVAQDLKRQVFLCTFQLGVTPPPKKVTPPVDVKKNKKHKPNTQQTTNDMAMT
jgi:hypothetical protein